jgi:hypothetical protein
MRIFISIAIFLFCGHAMGDQRSLLENLCPDVEGTYAGKIGEFQSRINLICIDKGRLMASVWQDFGPVDGKPVGDKVANLSNVAVDEDQLILANFQLGNEERRNGSSKSLVTYLRIDLAALHSGRLHGVFMTGNAQQLKTVDGTRIQTYMRFPDIPLKQPLTKNSVAGSYALSNSTWGAATVIFDVLLGTPVLYFRPTNTGESIRFTDGMKWDASGRFSLATPEGNGGEPDDRKLYYIRGHFLDGGQMEFYMISPITGMEGPLKAVKL